MMIARRYNLTGYARNLDNGDVEVEVQGEGVDEFLKDTLKNDTFIQIYDYSVKDIALDEHETNFTIKG